MSKKSDIFRRFDGIESNLEKSFDLMVLASKKLGEKKEETEIKKSGKNVKRDRRKAQKKNFDSRLIFDENTVQTSTDVGLKRSENEKEMKDFREDVERNVNRMNSREMQKVLERFELDGSGSRQQMLERIREHLIIQKLTKSRKSVLPTRREQPFDYFIVMDVECTCTEILYNFPHEIIELPAVLVDTRTKKVVSKFRTYVKPIKNPILGQFCIDFTGITQKYVDNAPDFRIALDRFFFWLRSNGLDRKGVKCAVVCDGPHDMWKFMQYQCMLSGIRMPKIFRSFVNIKKIFKEKIADFKQGNGKTGIEHMLAKFGKTFQGDKHCGLADARNLAYIVIRMLWRNIEIRINQHCTRNPKNPHQSRPVNPDDTENDLFYLDSLIWEKELPLKLEYVSRRDFLEGRYKISESDDEEDNQCYEILDEKEQDEYFEQLRIADMEENEELEKDEEGRKELLEQMTVKDELVFKNGRFPAHKLTKEDRSFLRNVLWTPTNLRRTFQSRGKLRSRRGRGGGGFNFQTGN